MRKLAILTSVLALAGFGLVGPASAGGPTFSPECGEKLEVCAFRDILWEMTFACGSNWEDDNHNTSVNFGERVFWLRAQEVVDSDNGSGTCNTKMVGDSEDDVDVYIAKCTLPRQKGGKNVSLRVEILGDCTYVAP